MAAQNYEIDMTSGSLVKNIIRFSLPLIASNILQLMYNAADVIVVGKFVGSEALAAVGASGSLINLLINIFVGLSVGISVSVSKYYGSREFDRLNNTIHTAIALALIGGVLCLINGELAPKTILRLMQTPDDVIDNAVLYVSIYFIGVPASLLYNFCAAVLRAVGDTRRPLYILTISGIVNVVLNLVLVIVFKLGIAGVAIATSVSNYISMVLVIYCLKVSRSTYSIDFHKIKIHMTELKPILRVGIPAGINGAIFSFSNIILQSAINGFGALAVAGSTAGSNIEVFVYSSMNAIHHASLTSASQNLGAHNKKRIEKSFVISMITVIIIGVTLGFVVFLFRHQLLGLYTNDKRVISYGAIRVAIICLTYFTCGIMEVEVGFLRGIGFSLTPAVSSFVGVCGIRLLWVYTVFAMHHAFNILFFAWPVSWVITSIFNAVVIIVFGRRKIKL